MRHRSLSVDHANRSASVVVSLRRVLQAIDVRRSQSLHDVDAEIGRIESHLRRTPEFAGTASWQVVLTGLYVLRSSLTCREMAHSGKGDISNERERLAVLCGELRTQLAEGGFEVGAISEVSEQVFTTDRGVNLEQLLSLLRRLPLPTTYWERAKEQFPVRQERSSEESEDTPPSPLVRVIASLDDAPLVTPLLLQPGLLYSLTFTLRGIGWHPGAEKIRLDLVTTCPSSDYSVSEFALRKPASFENQEYQGDMTGQIRFHAAQSTLSGDLTFVVKCAFELPDGGYAEVPVIGHNQLDFRVVSPDGIGLMSGYRRLDKHVVQLLAGLLKANPSVRGELADLLPMMDALTCLLGTYAQGAVFKQVRTLSEREFQSEVIRDLRVRLGEDVQEHPSQAGGSTDVRYRGVIVEMKVERENGDRRHIGQKYARQSAQYEGVEGRQISVVMVLDLTPKDNPPGDIRDDILLVDVPTHGGDDGTKQYPSKAFVFVVNGNTRNPSDYSK